MDGLGANFTKGARVESGGVIIDLEFPTGTFTLIDPVVKPPMKFSSPIITAGSNDRRNPLRSPGNGGVGLTPAVSIFSLSGLLVGAIASSRSCP